MYRPFFLPTICLPIHQLRFQLPISDPPGTAYAQMPMSWQQMTGSALLHLHGTGLMPGRTCVGLCGHRSTNMLVSSGSEPSCCSSALYQGSSRCPLTSPIRRGTWMLFNSLCCCFPTGASIAAVGSSLG